MKLNASLLVLFTLLLASCSVSPTSSGSSIATSSAEESSASSVTSSAEESSLSSESSSISEENSASSEESRQDSSIVASSSVSSNTQQVPGQGAWELTDDALPPNPAQGKLVDVSFSVLNGAGETVSFFGTNLLHGAGSKSGISIDDTIQMSKESSYFYMSSGYASYIQFSILKITQTYGGETHDFTGTPSLYCAETMTEDNGDPIDLTVTEEDEAHIVYGAIILPGRFRLANESSYALYIQYLRNLA